MAKLINGRTAEEIKKGLQCCFTPYSCYEECPYYCDKGDIGDCTSELAKDALALIERLEAAQPRWISMKDRLPTEKDATEDGLVLCVLKNVDGTISKERRAWHWENIVDMADCFSHWMQLPEPPKEGAHE